LIHFFMITLMGILSIQNFHFSQKQMATLSLHIIFFEQYKKQYGAKPKFLWPSMQAYDAANILISAVKDVNEGKETNELLSFWLRNKLHRVKYYKGVCGNISIGPNGASTGINFSLYKYIHNGLAQKIKQ